MNVVVDINVVLDVLLNREPHAKLSHLLLQQFETGHLIGYLCPHAVTTIYYLIHKKLGTENAKSRIGTLLKLFKIIPVDGSACLSALNTRFPDFEDAVLHEAARHAGLDGIVTRNNRDFAMASLPIYTPAEILAAIGKPSSC